MKKILKILKLVQKLKYSKFVKNNLLQKKKFIQIKIFEINTITTKNAIFFLMLVLEPDYMMSLRTLPFIILCMCNLVLKRIMKKTKFIRQAVLLISL